MELKPEIEEILIKECTDQELSAGERAVLTDWLKQSKRHGRILAQMRLTFLHPNAQNRAQIQGEVWADLQSRLVPETAHLEKGRKRNYWTKVAVVLVVCLSLGWLTLQSIGQFGRQDNAANEIKVIEKVSLPGQKFITSLPDGTIVKLNAESKIIVPDRFVGDTREITLFGEAFFDVAKDKSKPFIINTKDIKVEVVGTSFNVRSYPGKDCSIVAVATGKVAVTSGNEQEHLIPGEKLSYQSDLGKMEKGSFDWEEEFGWKDNILVFKGSNFSEILEKLSSWYGVEFKIEGNIHELNKKFSGRYQDATLSSVLDGMSYVYDFTYQTDKKKIILKTKKE